MAALSNAAYNLSDWAKTLDPDGKIARTINLLGQSNEILDDMTFMEGNLETGHQTTALVGLPSVAYRMLNAGVLPSKSLTAQYVEQTGMLEAFSRVDRDLAKLGGNIAAFRMAKAGPFLESMNQTFAQRLFYGNVGVEPEAFTGLSPRYSSLTAGNAQNIVDAGGLVSNNTSVWLVAWGTESVTGIFPKGSSVGLMHEDLGERLDQNTNGVAGAMMIALVEHWQWKHGLCLADWRFAVRIANVDTALATVDLIDKMELALELLPNNYGKRVFYMNRRARRILRTQARGDVSVGGGLSYENFDGKRILHFGDIPIHTVDQLLNTETRVV